MNTELNLDYAFNIWENSIALVSIFISVFIAIWIYRLTKKLSAKDKYEQEIKITNEIYKLGIYTSVILADVKKYHPLRKDSQNKTYYKQGAELYTIVQEYGVQFILRGGSADGIQVGLVPFEWIEYIRESDSEDNKPIFVCHFKGKKLYKKFKSPFKEINLMYHNPNYEEHRDPPHTQYSYTKPHSVSWDKKIKQENQDEIN